MTEATLSNWRLLTINEGDRFQWPVHGNDYQVEFEVEYIGSYYEDVPYIDVTSCPEELRYIFSDHTVGELVNGDELPIASGQYIATFTFHSYPQIDWETGYHEDDYGFVVSNLKHTNPFTNKYYVQNR